VNEEAEDGKELVANWLERMFVCG